MSYVIAGIDPAPFRRLYSASEAALAAEGALRVVADASHGFPCRVTLADAQIGETLLLINYEHLPVDTPYRSRHAIYLREFADSAARFHGRVPPQLARRLISLRAFDARGMMVNADVIDGGALEPLIVRFLEDPTVAYLHAHYARHGCFAARIDRG